MTGRFGLVGLGSVLMVLTMGMVFLWVPTDKVLGISQKIFYVHVPVALVGFLAFGVVVIGSVGYLWKKSERMDALAYASAEIGVLFTSLMLITGMLWAKPVWGVWWTWSPQLTTSLILWFIYTAYLMLRAYSPQGGQGARYAAVVGIIGFLDVPVVYMAAKWWRDVHPQAVVGPLADEGTLEGAMVVTFLVGLLSFTVLFSCLLLERYSLRRQEFIIERLRYTYD